MSQPQHPEHVDRRRLIGAACGYVRRSHVRRSYVRQNVVQNSPSRS